jgi:hypothetical protein
MGIDSIVLTFAYKYLEYIIGVLGTVGVVAYIKTKKVSNNSNDLTNLIVKQKKYNEVVNKRGKSSM